LLEQAGSLSKTDLETIERALRVVLGL